MILSMPQDLVFAEFIDIPTTHRLILKKRRGGWGEKA
jgi:hypothetical protein